MKRIALLPSLLACSLLACSNPAANDGTVQQFTGRLVFAEDGCTGYFDSGSRFNVQKRATVDATATVSPLSDLRFRLAVRRDAFEVVGDPLVFGDAFPPPSVTARWDLGPGTYRVTVHPDDEAMPFPIGQTFSVIGTITYP